MNFKPGQFFNFHQIIHYCVVCAQEKNMRRTETTSLDRHQMTSNLDHGHSSSLSPSCLQHCTVHNLVVLHVPINSNPKSPIEIKRSYPQSWHYAQSRASHQRQHIKNAGKWHLVPFARKNAGKRFDKGPIIWKSAELFCRSRISLKTVFSIIMHFGAKLNNIRINQLVIIFSMV